MTPEALTPHPKDTPQAEIIYRFFTGTGRRYDRMAHLCTLGFDHRWKRRVLENIPKNPVRIMDQACGTGILTIEIARRFPGCSVTGVDLLEEYLRIAVKKVSNLRLRNVEFVMGRAEEVTLKRSFDCIASSYLAKYADLERLIRNNAHMLKKGGAALLHDFTYPPSPLFARIWRFYFRILQNAGSRKYPEWRAIFYGLSQLVRETRWVRESIRLLKENGFQEIKRIPLTWGTSALITAVKV
jgi:demethylmenaquinone methyltransferase/2-methoxy-6-polyprenyl-1,4-benzoquinol methylase